jgi:hypothetical protein
MKSQIVEYYGVYNTDDRGYNIGPPVSIWPIKAAAVAKDCYQNVYAVNILKIEDCNYIVKKEIHKDSLLGKVKSFIPTPGYYEHIYENGFDKSKYYYGDKLILEVLSDQKSHSLRKIYLISDGEKTYELEFPDEVKVEKLIMSRELAINHALSKLTDEEKGLLGLK